MSGTWEIEYDSVTQSAADWGISGLQRKLVSQDQDILSFVAPGTGLDDDALFPADSIIKLKKDDITWFYGRVVRIPRSGSPDAEDMYYEAAGPWWWLDNLVFQQKWKVSDGAGGTTDEYKSRIILGQDTDGNHMTVANTIREVLEYAIDECDAPIAIGTISPTVVPPWAEVVDVACSEAIRKMLRWAPNCVTWFDYSESTPTFHCKPRSALTALSYSVADGHPAHRLDITPRNDLQVPVVVIKYERTDTVNGVEYEKITKDTSPEDSGDEKTPGALVVTIELAGSERTYVSETIKTEDLPDDYNSLSWWKSKKPDLNDTEIESITITDGDFSGDPGTTPRIVTEGQLQEWMNAEASDEQITAKARIEKKNGDKAKNTTLTFSFVATDSQSTTYHRLSSYVSGEETPTGLAAAVYGALSALHYEGAFTLLQEEVTLASLGYVLNLSNGQAAWASMNALCQSIDQNIDDGITVLNFGPPEHLSPSDFVDLLRANRGRRPAYSFARRVSGRTSDGGHNVAQSGKTPVKNTTSGIPEYETLGVSNTDSTKKITLDPSLMTNEAATEMKPRELEICVDGSPKTVLVLMSEPYD